MRQTHEEWKRQVFRDGITGYGQRYLFKQERRNKPKENDMFGRWITVTINGKKHRLKLRQKFDWEKELELALGSKKW